MPIKEITQGADYYIEKMFEGLRERATTNNFKLALQHVENLQRIILKLDDYFSRNHVEIEFNKAALLSSCVFLEAYFAQKMGGLKTDLSSIHVKPYAAYLSLYFGCLKKLS